MSESHDLIKNAYDIANDNFERDMIEALEEKDINKQIMLRDNIKKNVNDLHLKWLVSIKLKFKENENSIENAKNAAISATKIVEQNYNSEVALLERIKLVSYMISKIGILISLVA